MMQLHSTVVTQGQSMQGDGGESRISMLLLEENYWPSATGYENSSNKFSAKSALVAHIPLCVMVCLDNLHQ